MGAPEFLGKLVYLEGCRRVSKDEVIPGDRGGSRGTEVRRSMAAPGRQTL